MERIFENYAPKYYEKGLIVTPAIGKAPYLKEWQNKDIYKDFEKIATEHGARNIGLLLGEPSGVIAIDIDKEESLNLVPPSPVRKKGAKGETRFFKYNGEFSRKRMDVGIELLSTGNQTILPPSIHPDINKSYSWVTTDTLLDFDVNDLPVLPESFVSSMNNNVSSESKITPSDGSRCEHGSHNQLSSMLVAAIHSGDTPDVILKNLLDYDEKINPHVSYFICPSRPEWKTKERVINALKFITQGFESQAKKGLISNIKAESSVVNIVDGSSINIEPELKREKLPRLLGIGQKMFEYMYSMSATPKSHQILSYVMSLSSVLMSNRYQLEGTFSNTFTLVFSESGGGKNEGQDFITALLEQSGMSGLIGERLAGGSTAMIMNLPDFRERIDIVSEGTRFFEAINSNKEYKSEMALVYSDLFNSGGKGFYNKSNQQEKKDNKGNKQGRIGECFSPCVTLLITINLSSSRILIKNKMYEQGFMARLNVRLDSDRKKRKPYGGSVVDNIPYEFIGFIKSAGPIKKVMENNGVGIDLNTPEPLKKFIVPEIPVDEDAMKRIKEIEQEIIEMEYTIKSDDMMLYVTRRAYENFKKNILCITPLSLSRLTNLRVSMKEVEWAWELTKTDLNNHKLYIRKEIIDSKKELLMKKIFSFIKENKKATKTDICRKVRGDKREREEAISDLKECGYIKENKENKDNKTCFYEVFNELNF